MHVVVYDAGEPGRTVVAALDPQVILGLTGRDDIAPLATEVKERMQRVMEAVAAGDR